MPREEIASPRPALLGFLILGPEHPYGLNKLFGRELGRVWRLGQSHLYAHLARLAESGLAAVEAEAQVGRPDRKVYRITPAGRKAFLAWLNLPTRRVRDIRLEFLARLYFFRRLALPGLGDVITGQKALLRSRLASIDREIAGTEDEYWRLVLEFRRGEVAAIVAWLDECRSPKRAKAVPGSARGKGV
jgi:PadR family transcriptional regulator, regulatory protein AphA